MAAPTYNKDIAPILNSQCVLCHRPGEVAPFSLLTYQDAARRAALIATVAKNRIMPPRKAEAGFGTFQHERRLTTEQIGLIDAWAKAGAPEGNPKDRSPVPTFAEGWQAGEPGLIIKAGNGFNVSAEGPDRFQCFVLPLNLEQDSYIQTAEFHPGNRSVVHHGVIYVDETGSARRRAANSTDGSYPVSAVPAWQPPDCWPDGLQAVSPPPGIPNLPCP